MLKGTRNVSKDAGRLTQSIMKNNDSADKLPDLKMSSFRSSARNQEGAGVGLKDILSKHMVSTNPAD